MGRKCQYRDGFVTLRRVVEQHGIERRAQGDGRIGDRRAGRTERRRAAGARRHPRERDAACGVAAAADFAGGVVDRIRGATGSRRQKQRCLERIGRGGAAHDGRAESMDAVENLSFEARS